MPTVLQTENIKDLDLTQTFYNLYCLHLAQNLKQQTNTVHFSYECFTRSQCIRTRCKSPTCDRFGKYHSLTTVLFVLLNSCNRSKICAIKTSVKALLFIMIQV